MKSMVRKTILWSIFVSLILIVFCFDSYFRNNFRNLIKNQHEIATIISNNQILSYLHSCLAKLETYQANFIAIMISSYSIFFAVISFISNHFNELVFGITFQEIYEECYKNKSLERVKKILIFSSIIIFLSLALQYVLVALVVFAYVFIQQCKILLATNLLTNKNKMLSLIGKLIKNELSNKSSIEEMTILYRLSSQETKRVNYDQLISFLFQDILYQMKIKEYIPHDKYFVYAYYLSCGVIVTGMNEHRGSERNYTYLIQRLEEIEQIIMDQKGGNQSKDYYVYHSVVLGILIAPITRQDSLTDLFYTDVFKYVINSVNQNPSKYIIIYVILVYLELLFTKRINTEPLCGLITQIKDFKNFPYYHKEYGKKQVIQENIYLLCLHLLKFDGISGEDVCLCYERIYQDYSSEYYCRGYSESYAACRIRKGGPYDTKYLQTDCTY